MTGREKILALAALALAFLALPRSKINQTTGETETTPSIASDVVEKVISTVRGLRNNNPGNIRKTGTQWQGMAADQTDSAFVVFESPEYGIRAMDKILDSYAKRGIVRLGQIIGTWAPPNENDTNSYIDAVSASTGLAPSAIVTAADRPALIAAIIKHENGINPYSVAQIETGVSLA